MSQIKDHPQRYALTGELHARPFPALKAPASAVFLAIKPEKHADAPDTDASLAHLIKLLDHYGAPRPDPDATHHYGKLGKFWLKWEQHTEFVTYTVIKKGLSDVHFDPREFDVFPDYWLAEAPGARLTSALVRLEQREGTDAQIAQNLSDWFVPESMTVASVLDEAAVVATDFRIDPAGHLRIAVFVSPQTGSRRTGRILQRLCEIETYKTASMLGFSTARAIQPQIGALDARLSALMVQMRDKASVAEETLHALLDISGELENLAAQSAFRFGATGAYQAIVDARITALRETRFMGRQGLAEFMMRRYAPAMRTVNSCEDRLKTISTRARQASELLRTRVDVQRSAQNQQILASMDKRADLQLRLQHTVEGLSVVAISYYAVSLAGSFLYPIAAMFDISKPWLLAGLTAPVVGGVWWMLRRLRKRIH